MLACCAPPPAVQLGDNDEWAKQTNFEHATRIPLIVAVPGQQGGRRSAVLVEAVDIYPTLVEAATGTQLAHCPAATNESRRTAACTEGFSLLPLVVRGAEVERAWPRQASHSQFPRACKLAGRTYCGAGEKRPDQDKAVGIMGYTMRMDRWRYTAWVRFNYSTAAPEWSEVFGRELYDHGASPVPSGWDMETENVVGAPEHASLVAQLHARLVRCGQRPDLC